MKTTISITMAIAAMCALGASALADQQPNQQSIKKAKMSGAKASTTSTAKAKTWDDQPMPLRAVGYPVVLMGRAGHSIIRSPQIMSDTLKGKRDLVSKKGVMTERDTTQAKQTKKTTK
jgi:hypothetical protein